MDTPGESSCSVTPLLKCGHAWELFLLRLTSTSVWTGPAPGCVWLGTALQRAASRVQSISKVTHAYPATSTYNEGGGNLSISVQRFRLFVLNGHICSLQLYLLVLHYFFYYFIFHLIYESLLSCTANKACSKLIITSPFNSVDEKIIPQSP